MPSAALFVEPAMPYDPLGILHMTIYTKRLATLDVRELGGAHAGEVRPALVALARPNRHIAPHGWYA